MTSLGEDETCSFLRIESTTGCRAARSCASCLITTGCLVDPVGKCVSPHDEAYDPNIEFGVAIHSGLVVTEANASTPEIQEKQVWQFPAGMARYCDTDDVQCQICRRANFWRDNTTFPDSRFCLGDDGFCVCVDVCERPRYVAPDCSSSPLTLAPTSGYNLTSENIGERLWRALLSISVFLLAVLVIMYRRKIIADRVERARVEQERQQQEARERRRQARATALGVKPLTLSGWETHRRELIDKETAQLSGQDHSDTPSRAGSLGVEEGTTAYVSLEESNSDPLSRTQRTPQTADSRSYHLATGSHGLLLRAPLRVESGEREAPRPRDM